MIAAKNWPWKWISLALTAIAIGAALKFLPLAEWLKEFNEWVKGLGLCGVLVYAGVYALATVLFLPAWIFTVAQALHSVCSGERWQPSAVPRSARRLRS
ncbi:MAG: hypothetical protein H0W04_00335 [Chthoniobacterales bacterium]|nr:hypothetical protein [Chthoniobacterales bacterium]